MPDRPKQLQTLLIVIVALLAVVVVLIIRLSTAGRSHAAPPNALLNLPLPAAPATAAESEPALPEPEGTLNAAAPGTPDEATAPQDKPVAPATNAVETPRAQTPASAPRATGTPKAAASALTEKDLEGVPDEFRPSQSTVLEAALVGHEDWQGKVRSHSADWARATVWIGPPASEYATQLEVTWNVKGQYYDITGRKALAGR